MLNPLFCLKGREMASCRASALTYSNRPSLNPGSAPLYIVFVTTKPSVLKCWITGNSFRSHIMLNYNYCYLSILISIMLKNNLQPDDAMHSALFHYTSNIYS